LKRERKKTKAIKTYLIYGKVKKRAAKEVPGGAQIRNLTQYEGPSQVFQLMTLRLMSQTKN